MTKRNLDDWDFIVSDWNTASKNSGLFLLSYIYTETGVSWPKHAHFSPPMSLLSKMRP